MFDRRHEVPEMRVTAQQMEIMQQQAAVYYKGWSISPSRGLFGCTSRGWNLPADERPYFPESFWEELTDKVLLVRRDGGRVQLEGSNLVMVKWGITVLRFALAAACE